jgi:branched-chain amino acid transport system substrate-binding protein
MKAFKTLAAVAATLLASAAQADITIGISLPLTGPASGLGIPMANYIKLWPTEIAGEKLKVIVLDDATDPTKGVTNAKKFVTEDKVDIIMGSAATPVAIAMADTAAESGTPQFMFSPAVLPAGKDFYPAQTIYQRFVRLRLRRASSHIHLQCRKSSRLIPGHDP